eukprot:TRINITY_DN8977_c0_g1_i2.p1 TRINITY_DN8977_c0_g1~~TRINITY_DN8977_c0_g1_i2.p1  ORF type:complete len:315 (+),score=-22.37 TRINITY_DN8977_c0_g1_i2:957-1901(+)
MESWCQSVCPLSLPSSLPRTSPQGSQRGRAPNSPRRLRGSFSFSPPWRRARSPWDPRARPPSPPSACTTPQSRANPLVPYSHPAIPPALHVRARGWPSPHTTGPPCPPSCILSPLQRPAGSGNSANSAAGCATASEGASKPGIRPGNSANSGSPRSRASEGRQQACSLTVCDAPHLHPPRSPSPAQRAPTPGSELLPSPSVRDRARAPPIVLARPYPGAPGYPMCRSHRGTRANYRRQRLHSSPFCFLTPAAPIILFHVHPAATIRGPNAGRSPMCDTHPSRITPAMPLTPRPIRGTRRDPGISPVLHLRVRQK